MPNQPKAKWQQRMALRIAAFLAAATAALGLLPWTWSPRLLPALSPVLGVCGTIALRALPWVALTSLPLALLALWRGRWFCAHLCPTGLACESIGRAHPSGADMFRRWPRLGLVIFVLLLGSAIAGYPLALWLDPLAMFNGFFAAWRRPITFAAALPAMGFLGVMLLSLVRPRAWCFRLCPLGATQDALSQFRRVLRRQAVAQTAAAGIAPTGGLRQRAFLGVLAGGVAGLTLRAWTRWSGERMPIRPPGAAPEHSFAGMCARCGNCLKVCPYRLIVPDIGSGGLASLLTPVLNLSRGHCNEWCHACTHVCPTGAIRPMTLDAKRHLAIGLAVVSKSRCIAWNRGAHCLVCQEFCPYLAIRAVTHRGAPCPVVDPDMCRGCGACQNACPAQPERAIIVHGIAQRSVTALPTFH